MHVGKKFALHHYAIWTKRELLYLFCLSALPASIHLIFGWIPSFKFPYFISAMLGTSAAFVIALKNNNAINRFDEGSKLYNEIRAISYNLGLQLQAHFLHQTDEIKTTAQKIIIKQHIAWLTTLRYLLRKEKAWENLHAPGNKEFREENYIIPENKQTIEDALEKLLTPEQLMTIRKSDFDPLYCLQLQATFIKKLIEEDKIQIDFFNRFNDTIENLNTLTISCTRLKNTPYPRSFFSITQIFLGFFLLALPFSVYSELAIDSTSWTSIPISIAISVIIGWVFICLEKVGQNTSNPFEGGVNDVPITSISTKIEIDLKTMCNFPKDQIPQPLKPMSGFIEL